MDFQLRFTGAQQVCPDAPSHFLTDNFQKLNNTTLKSGQPLPYTLCKTIDIRGFLRYNISRSSGSKG